MICLMLAIVCSALVSIIMRISETRIENHITMLAANYAVCLLFACFYTRDGKIFSIGTDYRTALGLGFLNGFLYMTAFILLQLNIKRNGVVLSATFMKLGVLIPTIFAVLIFRESPQLLQMSGFFIALLAIILINIEKGQEQAAFKTGLILLLLTGGAADGMSKVFSELGDSSLEDHFLLYTFLMALVLCTALAFIKRQHICTADLIFGVCMGIPNFLSTKFLLKSLQSVPAVAAYPTYSAATLLVVTAAGVAVFKERLSGRQKIAVGLILTALVLMNL